MVSMQRGFFSKLVVDAVMMLDEHLPLKMIGIKKVQGGGLEVRGGDGGWTSTPTCSSTLPSAARCLTTWCLCTGLATGGGRQLQEDV